MFIRILSKGLLPGFLLSTQHNLEFPSFFLLIWIPDHGASLLVLNYNPQQPGQLDISFLFTSTASFNLFEILICQVFIYIKENGQNIFTYRLNFLAVLLIKSQKTFPSCTVNVLYRCCVLSLKMSPECLMNSDNLVIFTEIQFTSDLTQFLPIVTF